MMKNLSCLEADLLINIFAMDSASEENLISDYSNLSDLPWCCFDTSKILRKCDNHEADDKEYFNEHTEGYKSYVKYSYNPAWWDTDVESWRRARWLNGMEVACKHHVFEPDRTIVCDHWHTSYGFLFLKATARNGGGDADFSPFYSDGIIALDQCVAYTAFLNVVVLNGEELGGEDNV